MIETCLEWSSALEAAIGSSVRDFVTREGQSLALILAVGVVCFVRRIDLRLRRLGFGEEW